MTHRRLSTWIAYLLAGVLACALVPASALAEGEATSQNSPQTQATPQDTTTTHETNSATCGQTLRVGFVNQPGSFSVDDQGNYTGYTYDYLIQLAQYTGWNYEFVEAPGTDANEKILNSLKMLENGEVDLLGTMNYSEKLAENYEYPQNSYGYFHAALYVADNTTTLTKTNLYTRDEMSVAVKAGATTYQQELESFCERLDIKLTIKEYASFDEMSAAVDAGEVNALLDLDINLHPNYHIVATLQQRPFFFASKKGNTATTKAIDSAITRMNVGNPSLQINLYQKYFGSKEADLSLTPQEFEYIKQHKTLRVGVIPNKAPIQSLDAKTGEITGVTKSILDYLSEKTGLQFEIVPLNYGSNFAQTLREQNIDIVAGLDNNYEQASNWEVSLTAPYVIANTLIVFNRQTDPTNLEGKTLAVPLEQQKAFDGVRRGSVLAYDNLSACFNAVDEGRADYTYANTYTTPYYINAGGYSNLNFLAVSISTSQTCFGIVSPIEPDLLLVLNKAIRSIPESTLSSMIYEASLTKETETVEVFIKKHLPEIFLLIMVVLVVIIALLALYLRTRSRAAKSAREENRRHREIYSISNEPFFEYSPHTDTLIISIPSTMKERLLGHSNNVFSAPLSEEETHSHVNETSYCTFPRISTEKYDFFSPELIAAIITPEKPIADVTCPDAQGEQAWFRITSRIITDKAGRPTSIVGKIIDVSDEVREKAALSQRAEHDGLTGLLNRTAFQEGSEQLLAGEHCGAFLIIDVDAFKDVNDTYGHLAGDEALRRTSELLKQSFRPSDLIGRLGGDEFAVCIRGSISRQMLEDRCADLVANGISFSEAEGIEKPGTTEHRITLSLGCVLLKTSQKDYEVVSNCADQALYEAKRTGRDRFIIREL